jgi:hypothetical protein
MIQKYLLEIVDMSIFQQIWFRIWQVSAVRRSTVYSFPYNIYLHQQNSVCNMEADKIVVPFCSAANISYDRKVEYQQGENLYAGK